MKKTNSLFLSLSVLYALLIFEWGILFFSKIKRKTLYLESVFFAYYH
ncbi:hypothetical protein KIS1582_5044 [Cytobacillus firmus]|uniref:Uncharacterized protein n=1 Tax=Cytobacillus firmus TaxID=1399 RepID=A0A800MS03_CYTFI|nr:hypothetical protein KIS1582_5044 [Cytobacillus firmus]